jgi:hypothetical protein
VEKMSKYRNRKTIIDGYKFDSKLEAERYCELKLLLRTKKITDLVLQPSFELQPSFKKNGKTYRKIVYKADFAYKQDGKLIVEDTKGFKTKDYLLKKKMFEYKYPELEIKEITNENYNFKKRFSRGGR